MYLALLAAFAVTVWAAWTYNRFVRLGNQVREAWSGIDVHLRQRYDLVPRLAASVRSYADYEQALLTEVTALRDGAAARETTRERARDEGRVSQGLRRLVLVAEDYPELKASSVYLDLQRQLVDIEDQIQHARRYFNGSVRDWNNYLQSFPSLIVGRLLGYREKEYFEVELATERAAPGVKL